MDTPHNQPTPEGERPPAAVEQVFRVEDALEERGFQAFYDRTRPDGNVFEDAEDTEKVFKLFEMSRGAARRFETVMSAKLREQDKGPLKATEREACKEYVAKIAAENPDELQGLLADLDALETDPALIEAKEAEFAAIREANRPEKLAGEKANLEKRKKEVEEAVTQLATAKYGPVDKMLGWLGWGKKAGDREQQTASHEEWARIDSDIKALELRIAEAPTIIAKEQVAISKIREQIATAKEKIFMENEVAKKVRERLLEETGKMLFGALASDNLGKRQEAAKLFMKEVKSAESGVNFLDKGEGPNRDEFMELLWEGGVNPKTGEKVTGMQELFEKGVREAIAGIPLDAGQSRVLRAYQSFVRSAGLSGGAIGFMNESESREFVLDTLRTAEQDAKREASGTGRRIYYQGLIAHLEAEGTSPIRI